MKVSIEPKSNVWRGRGHPRRVIPPEVKGLADSTYRTGKVGVVHIGPDDEEDMVELRRMLISYAKSLGKRMRVQREDNQLRFEMVDRGTT